MIFRTGWIQPLVKTNGSGEWSATCGSLWWQSCQGHTRRAAEPRTTLHIWTAWNAYILPIKNITPYVYLGSSFVDFLQGALLEITVRWGCLLSVCQHVTAPAGRATFTLALPFYKVTLFNIEQGKFRSAVNWELWSDSPTSFNYYLKDMEKMGELSIEANPLCT